MSNSNGKKLDLLRECNENETYSKEFMERVFCKNCRNPSCVRAEGQRKNEQIRG